MDNIKKTEDFFNRWKEYHQIVAELDSYKFIAVVLQDEIRGHVLDVGNGGVFNYDVSKADKIVVVDIAEELVNRKDGPPNVTFKWGDATKLPIESGTFDTVLLQLLLHHLAENNIATTRARTCAAIGEAYRVLKPGGRLVILESCLPKPVEIAEKILFPVFRMFVKAINHPIVFQWNWNSLAGFTRAAGFSQVELTRVSLGRWVIQLGHKWPTALTPIRIYKIVAHKPVR